MAQISGSVGQGGDNRKEDVELVQKLLNAHVEALGLPRLDEDGKIGVDTVGAIRKYQADVLGMRKPDGRIDVGGNSWKALNEKQAPNSAASPTPASGKAKWTWDQSAGSLAWEGKVVAFGYAGKGAGKNNPDMQDVKKTGPIPRGLWRMTGVKNSPKTGPFTIVLVPEAGTDARGRSEFRVHGDNRTGTASEGCIILPRPIRDRLWENRAKAPLIEVVE